MGLWGLLQSAVFLLIVVALVKPLGGYLARVFEGEKTWLDSALRPIERILYKLARVDPKQEMDWRQYATAVITFGLAGTVLLYAILRLQQFLPGFDSSYITTPMSPDLAMNTAISFSTTTTWQAYGGESTIWTSDVTAPSVCSSSSVRSRRGAAV
ncbi:MAG TPA: potassium-transporting ATPase subunit KdpA [Blastocatellia bacterium]|nr:potassium-transporting ATPase subunit KdpA [Blastocatellia bacterium]